MSSPTVDLQREYNSQQVSGDDVVEIHTNTKVSQENHAVRAYVYLL
jgi:hypothetical protein